MTKAELVEKIHAKAGLPTKAKAEEALDAVVAALREALASGESVTFTGFGSFKVVERAARKGRNPRTGKEITIAALAHRIQEVIGYKGEVRFTPEKPDGTMRKLTDVTKLHNLGWHHKIEIEEGVQKMYDWYTADHAEMYR